MSGKAVLERAFSWQTHFLWWVELEQEVLMTTAPRSVAWGSRLRRIDGRLFFFFADCRSEL